MIDWMKKRAKQISQHSSFSLSFLWIAPATCLATYNLLISLWNGDLSTFHMIFDLLTSHVIFDLLTYL